VSHSLLKPGRRTFLAVGVAGAGALALAGWLRRTPAPAPGGAASSISTDGQDILRAVVPVMLAGALPQAPAPRAAAIAQTLAALETAVGGLPAGAQAELAQLFDLLSLPPVRIAVARIDVPWAGASPEQVRACLDRFRGSPVQLLRAAYDALHQLTFAAWYGNPQAWGPIGYPGPPELA
jgi:hypothetical protein